MSMRRAPRFRAFLAAFVLVPLAAGLLPSKAQTPDIDGQWLDAYNRADYAAAEALSRRLLAARPHDTDVRYNFACVLARQGRVEDALDALDAAVESGYVDPGAIARDPDLVALRDAPRFRTILAKPETRMEEACAAKRMTLREGAATPFKLEGPAGGPTAAGELTPSAEGLSLRLVVEGTTPRQGQRGWRAGDGLLVNVVRTAGGPSETTSERFVAWGFDREDGKAQATLVNEDGRWSLRLRPEYAPKIEVDAAAKRAVYEVRLPWSALGGLRPLADRAFALNLVYVVRDDAGARTFLRLVPDPAFDTEATDKRRGAPVTLELSGKNGRVVSAAPTTRIVGGTVPLRVHAAAPGPATARLSFAALDEGGRVVAERRRTITLQAGAISLEERLDLPPARSGLLTLRVALDGAPEWRETILRPDAALLARAAESLAAPAPADPRRRAALDALRLARDAAGAAIKAAGPRDDPARAAEALDALRATLDDLAAARGPFVRPGSHLAAVRSSVDGSLQPLTIWIPEGFDPSVPRDVVVALHGSGVDERGIVDEVAATLGPFAPLIVAPRGRGLSDWYFDATETDVLDAAKLAEVLCPARKVFIYGFSMGGFAAWRIPFFHPGVFDGAIVNGGGPYFAPSGRPETSVEPLAGKAAKETPFLVLHGTADRSVPIGPTDAWVAKLKTLGYDIVYVRREGGGHGDFDARAEIRAWFGARAPSSK